MPRQKPTTQLASLQKHQAALVEKLRAAKTKVKAEAKEAEREKHESVGAVALKEFAANPSSPFAAKLLALMNDGIAKASLRHALGLAALPRQTRKPIPAQPESAAPLAKPETTASPPAPPPAPAPAHDAVADAPPSSGNRLTALRGLFGGGAPPKTTK